MINLTTYSQNSPPTLNLTLITLVTIFDYHRYHFFNNSYIIFHLLFYP